MMTSELIARSQVDRIAGEGESRLITRDIEIGRQIHRDDDPIGIAVRGEHEGRVAIVGANLEDLARSQTAGEGAEMAGFLHADRGPRLAVERIWNVDFASASRRKELD